MNTKVEKLLNELEDVVRAYRNSAEDLEMRIRDIRKIAEEGDEVIFNAIVEKLCNDRREFRRYIKYSKVDNFECDRWHKLCNETLINAAACAEKDET